MVQHLSVSRIAAGLDVAWNTANDAVPAEGQRVLISDLARFDGVKVIGVDEHCWRHTRRGEKYVTVIIDLTPTRDGTGSARLLDMVEVVGEKRSIRLANLARHGHLDTVPDEVVDQVLAMSAATIDRRLAPARTGLIAGKGITHTRPGSLLKPSIPLKTWHEWNDTIPGFVQIDLVGHEGGDNNGQFHYSLDATDIATGWTETITVRSKGEQIVAAGLEQLQLRFPFHIAGIHSDNGAEFINHHLLRWCQARHINFSRGRASHSNDQAHVEQKNWSVVRRNVGYYRYDTARELDLLNQEQVDLDRDQWPELPQQKLLSKTRHGARVSKKHDQATTPLDRLLTGNHDMVDPHDRTRAKPNESTTPNTRAS